MQIRMVLHECRLKVSPFFCLKVSPFFCTLCSRVVVVVVMIIISLIFLVHALLHCRVIVQALGAPAAHTNPLVTSRNCCAPKNMIGKRKRSWRSS